MDVVERVVREVEGMEALDGPARPLAAAAGRATRPRLVKNALSGTWLGHPLHPMLTDVPVGSWVAAGLLDLAGGAQAGRAAECPWLVSGCWPPSPRPPPACPTGRRPTEPSSGWASCMRRGTWPPCRCRRRPTWPVGGVGGGAGARRRRAGDRAGRRLSGRPSVVHRGVGVNDHTFQRSRLTQPQVALLSDLAPRTRWCRVVRDRSCPCPAGPARGGRVRALSPPPARPAAGHLMKGTGNGCVPLPWHGDVSQAGQDRDGRARARPPCAGRPAGRCASDGGPGARGPPLGAYPDAAVRQPGQEDTWTLIWPLQTSPRACSPSVMGQRLKVS